MNTNRFEKVMRAIDDDLLEQAQQRPGKNKGMLLRIGALAACFCIIAGLFWFQPQRDKTGLTADDIKDHGYELRLPLGAESIVYALVDFSDSFAVPMAQATFEVDGIAYICKAQKSEEPVDISGMDENLTETMDWNEGSLHLQLRKDEDFACVTWYEAQEGIQWCLSSNDALKLINTASQIIEQLGYSMDVAPENAENVVYNAFMVEDMTAAETRFTVNGVEYSYRTAGAVQFVDLSQKEIPGAEEKEAKLGWCQAKILWNEGGEGKILWYDIAPGLLYSLYMENGASAEALLQMAETLYKPAQGDV